MANDFFDQVVTDYTRKGALERVKLLKGLHKKIMPSQFERIKRNDKSVFSELLLPRWVSWELLRAWAENFSLPGKGRVCILCNEQKEHGLSFNDRFICENCFVRLKQLE